jgi:DNA-binding XRE family transcriptional regulator
MEQRKAELRENLRQPSIAAELFLRDLRGLRAKAGLEQGDLAARAHYPRSLIAAAEAGPMLPELPMLAAYVRGCGGTEDDVAGWEDRWRSVSGVTASPLLSTRGAAGSETAPASAPAGIPAASPPTAWASASAAADGEDSSAIMAALDRFAERMSQPGSEEQPPLPPPAPEAVPSATSGLSSATASLAPSASPSLAAEPGSPAEPAAEPAGSRAAPGQHGRGRMPSWTPVVVIVVAVLVCVLLILLAL